MAKKTETVNIKINNISDVTPDHDRFVKTLSENIHHWPAATTSATRYKPVSTLDLIDTLGERGFKVRNIAGAYSSKSFKAHGRHTVELVNAQASLDIGGTFPQIRITNSYDGKSGLRIEAGIFRLVCSNGLTNLLSGTVDSYRHLAGIEGALDYVDTFAAHWETVGDKIEHMQQIELPREKEEKLARAFAILRQQEIWGSKFNINTFNVAAETMLTPVRPADSGSDSWTTFNILQEKVLTGGYSHQPGTGDKRVLWKTARGISNPYTASRINEKLFPLFEQSFATDEYVETVLTGRPVDLSTTAELAVSLN
jgi:hypothetical protein